MLRIILVLLLAAWPVRAAEETFYIGTYTAAANKSEGIYVSTLDPETGKLGPLRLAAKEADPNFLALSPDHRFVFAALKDSVASFAVQPDGTLRALNRQADGAGCCHVSVDGAGHFIFVANYGASTIAVFPVGADGTIGPRTAFETLTGSGPNKARQASSHAHSIYADPEGRFVYACDLGTDKIWIYRLDVKGALTPADPPFATVPPGSGPRHLVIDGGYVYVVNEMGASVSVFQRDPATGALKILQTASNIEGAAKPNATAAEIALSHGNLYVSTRGQEVLSVFHVEAHRLKLTQAIPSPVLFPRNFAIDPSGCWLIAAGQNGNRIAVMKIDAPSGQLTATDQAADVGSPVCILFSK